MDHQSQEVVGSRRREFIFKEYQSLLLKEATFRTAEVSSAEVLKGNGQNVFLLYRL